MSKASANIVPEKMTFNDIFNREMMRLFWSSLFFRGALWFFASWLFIVVGYIGLPFAILCAVLEIKAVIKLMRNRSFFSQKQRCFAILLSAFCMISLLGGVAYVVYSLTGIGCYFQCTDEQYAVSSALTFIWLFL